MNRKISVVAITLLHAYSAELQTAPEITTKQVELYTQPTHTTQPPRQIEAIRAHNQITSTRHEQADTHAGFKSRTSTSNKPSEIIPVQAHVPEYNQPRILDAQYSKDSTAPTIAPHDPTYATLENITQAFELNKNYITSIHTNTIEATKRIFKSSYSQAYHPKLFDPQTMSPNKTMKDYVEPLQETFPNTPPFMLERYIEMVLAETKSGQQGWLGKYPIVSPRDVQTYKPGWSTMSTPSDLQIVYRDMQAIEKIVDDIIRAERKQQEQIEMQKQQEQIRAERAKQEELMRIEQERIRAEKAAQWAATKDERVERANQERAARTIQKLKRGKESKPAIQITSVILKSFDSKGFPTESTIKSIILKDFFPNKNPQDIKVDVVRGGSFTNNIYRVSYQNKPVLFLKISSQPKSTQNLASLQQNMIGRIGMQSHYESALESGVQKNLPIVTWMEKIYTYKNQFGQNQIIEVMHAAKGKSVWSIVNDPKTTSATRAKIYETVGKSLGSFQQFFMKYNDPNNPATWETVSHGDFHPLNIFLDTAKSQVYLIDNETMQTKTLQETSKKAWNSVNELSDFKVFILSNRKWNKQNSDRTIEMQDNFIKGYLESFPADKRSILAQYLKDNSGFTSYDFDAYITPPTQSQASTINQPAQV